MKKLAIIGTPNVGKSSISNIICKTQKFKSANYSGVTVKSQKNPFYIDNEKYELYDLPGIYSFRAEEPIVDSVVKNLLFNPKDINIYIVDSTNLFTSLYYYLLLKELGISSLLFFNFFDILEQKKIFLNLEKFNKIFHCKSITTTGHNKNNFTKITKFISKNSKDLANKAKNSCEKFFLYNSNIDKAKNQLIKIINENTNKLILDAKIIAIGYLTNLEVIIKKFKKTNIEIHNKLTEYIIKWNKKK